MRKLDLYWIIEEGGTVVGSAYLMAKIQISLEYEKMCYTIAGNRIIVFKNFVFSRNLNSKRNFCTSITQTQQLSRPSLPISFFLYFFHSIDLPYLFFKVWIFLHNLKVFIFNTEFQKFLSSKTKRPFIGYLLQLLSSVLKYIYHFCHLLNTYCLPGSVLCYIII